MSRFHVIVDPIFFPSSDEVFLFGRVRLPVRSALCASAFACARVRRPASLHVNAHVFAAHPELLLRAVSFIGCALLKLSEV